TIQSLSYFAWQVASVVITLNKDGREAHALSETNVATVGQLYRSDADEKSTSRCCRNGGSGGRRRPGGRGRRHPPQHQHEDDRVRWSDVWARRSLRTTQGHRLR